MPYYVKNTQTELRGTLEVVHGVSVVAEPSDPSAPFEIEYAGETEMFWDDQKTVVVENALVDGREERVWIDEHGFEYLESSVEWRPEIQKEDAA